MDYDYTSEGEDSSSGVEQIMDYNQYHKFTYRDIGAGKLFTEYIQHRK